jgi:hypothetical protein
MSNQACACCSLGFLVGRDAWEKGSKRVKKLKKLGDQVEPHGLPGFVLLVGFRGRPLGLG